MNIHHRFQAESDLKIEACPWQMHADMAIAAWDPERCHVDWQPDSSAGTFAHSSSAALALRHAQLATTLLHTAGDQAPHSGEGWLNSLLQDLQLEETAQKPQTV